MDEVSQAEARSSAEGTRRKTFVLTMIFPSLQQLLPLIEEVRPPPSDTKVSHAILVVPLQNAGKAISEHRSIKTVPISFGCGLHGRWVCIRPKAAFSLTAS
jgi:hypothetical protein